MTHVTANNPARLQKTARRVLSTVCVLFAIGLASSAADKAAANSQSKTPVSIEAATPAPLAARELLHSVNPNQKTAKFSPVKGAKAGTEREPSPPIASAAEAELAKSSFNVNSKARTVWMEVTAYCPCPKCCGPSAAGITASGKKVSHNNGKFVAADSNFRFGTKLTVPGYNDNRPVEVLDRGSAIKGKKLDLFFPSHQQALEWGRKWVAVTIYE